MESLPALVISSNFSAAAFRSFVLDSALMEVLRLSKTLAGTRPWFLKPQRL